MKKNIKMIYGLVLALLVFLAAPAMQTYAYSEIPDCFDFEDCVISIPAGGTHKMWLAAEYDYTYFVEGATSDATYLECNYKRDSGYVTFHIGADEQGKNVFFHFYVRDDRRPDQDLHDCVEIYVQNIQPVTLSLQTPIAGKKVGTLVKQPNKTALLSNDQGVPMASFSLTRGNGRMAEFQIKGIENNGANYFSVVTGYDFASPLISGSDKEVMLANGYAGVCVNGKFVNWP
ncbi:hypothetical protein D6855_02910 [Butyrivibrio sp. CB08]|uniref:hypothetical protein n=1 Tax=Butyrivibrio sp. CB08 TaxID=2364879 RepID=UPI000EA96762|nr:hypothetical protein [Butyrivibrio sp. CB08]RKM62383.1 hypothetical protein D6855_02910 [Butyrivibrio sp. CB08]